MSIGRAVAVVGAIVLAIAAAGCGTEAYTHTGPYGVVVAPREGVRVMANGRTYVRVRCAEACHGTRILTALVSHGTPARLRPIAITPSQPFILRKPSGGTVEVAIQISHAGLSQLDAHGGRLLVTALMRYLSPAGRAAQTDHYLVELHS